MKTIEKALDLVIAQPDMAKVKVQRWFPGVVEEIVESINEKSEVQRQSFSVEARLLEEASKTLDHRQSLQVAATTSKSVKEILAGMQKEQPNLVVPGHDGSAATLTTIDLGGLVEPSRQPSARTKARRRRQKMRSTPVVGGGLFGETTIASRSHRDEEQIHDDSAATAADAVGRRKKTDFFLPNLFGGRAPSGYRAEIVVDGESYDIRINDETLKSLQTGYSGDWLDSHGVQLAAGPKLAISPAEDASPQAVVNRLHGYIRNPGMGLTQIVEEDVDSETSSLRGAH